tara:strand:+ start:6196 stop:6579 length:384 start_codon:yes stop_codon:yes gene_type:complete
MKEIKIPTNRNFGIVFSVVFLIISLWPLLSEETLSIWALILSIIFLILGLLNSKILSPLNKIWFKFGLFLGGIISPIVMAIIFFLVVTPMGIIMRVLNKDLLKLKKNNKSSYWLNKDNKKSSMKDQF